MGYPKHSQTPIAQSSTEEIDRRTGAAIGGAIMGASLGGPAGAILGVIVGVVLADHVNRTKRLESSSQPPSSTGSGDDR